MIVTILGSGTSGGVPMIGCNCEVCLSNDPRDKRLRSSINISVNNKNFVVDAGPDFRQQMLREKINSLDAIIFTHAHRDHTAGLDDIRAYNYFLNKPMDVYLNAETKEALKLEYSYVFDDKWYPGLPLINFFTIENTPFFIDEVKFTPIELLHYKMKVFGYRINNFTYITDANFISEEEKEKIKGSKILVLNALRKEKHISHFNLDEAITLAQELNAEKTYLTHISHQLGTHIAVEKELPDGIQLGFDGMRFEV